MYARGDSGQGSIELVAGVAALAAVCGLVVQIAVLGSAWLDAQGAARVADRAHAIGIDGAPAARSALAPARRPGAVIVRGADGRHAVTVRSELFGRPLRMRATAR